MSRTVVFDLIDKRITEKIYKKAREQEKKLSPDNFTAYYLRSSVVYWFVVFCLFVICTFIFGPFDKVFLYILGISSIGSFIIVLYHISYRCFVNDIGITVVLFWIFQKQIFWKDIKKVEVMEIEPYCQAIEKNAIIRNKKNRIIFSCSYDLVGFNLIVRKAKRESGKKQKSE